MIVVVMGVTGSGKSSVGERLAEALHLPFIEGDSFHDAANVTKMGQGIPLTDEDRRPWLDRLNAELRSHAATGAVLACSALTEAARERLTRGLADVRHVLLVGDETLLRSRLGARTGHFAGADLLASQLETLEAPADAVVVDVKGTPEETAARALSALRG